MFLDHTQRRSTVGRTPLDELSPRRRDLYLTTHNTHNRHTSMPPVGFEPTISAGERPQTYALDHAGTGTGCLVGWSTGNLTTGAFCTVSAALLCNHRFDQDFLSIWSGHWISYKSAFLLFCFVLFISLWCVFVWFLLYLCFNGFIIGHCVVKPALQWKRIKYIWTIVIRWLKSYRNNQQFATV